MAKIGNRLKLALLKSMEAIGKGASNLASNAHLKVSEINLETRRREILSEFPLRAHDLWQKGVELPQPLGDMMAELNDLDERLSVLRAQRYAKVEEAEAAKEAGENAPSAATPEQSDSAAEGEQAGDIEHADSVEYADATEHTDNDEHADIVEPAANAEAEEASASDEEPAQSEGDNA